MRKIKDKGTGKYFGIAEQELKPIKNRILEKTNWLCGNKFYNTYLLKRNIQMHPKALI